MKRKYILGSINIILSILLYLTLLLSLLKLNIISHTIIITISIIYIIIIILSLISYLSKNKYIYNISQFISFLINLILLFNISNIESNYNYYTNIITNKYNYQEYTVYVQKKNTTYNKIDKLSNKKIATIKEDNKINDNFNNKSIKFIECNSIIELEENLKNGNAQAIFIKNDEYNKLSEDTKEIIKPIYNTKIKILNN